MLATPKSSGTAAQDIARLRQDLEEDIRRVTLEPGNKPFLVILSGLPGTGKSHFARELSQRLPFVTVGSDRSRKVLEPRPKYSPEEHYRVFAACHRLVEDYLAQGYRVIFDATNLTEYFRQPLYQAAERRNVPMELVSFTAPHAVIRRRLAGRVAGRLAAGHSDADWLIYCRLRPGQEPIARAHISVDSSRDISPALEKVLRRVRSGN